MERWDSGDCIWPKAFQTVGLMLKHNTLVRAGCRKCNTFLYVNKKNLTAIAHTEGGDYSLINRVSKCRVVGCGGDVFYYASSDDHTPFKPLKDSLLEKYNEGIILKPARGKHYWVHSQLCKEPVAFLMDTGATETILSHSDASRLDINPRDLAYRCRAKTMKGSMPLFGAKFAAMRVGEAIFLNQMIWVAENFNGPSLMGLDFLTQFKEVRLKDKLCHIRFASEATKTR